MTPTAWTVIQGTAAGPLATENFPDANGSPWPAQWTTSASGGSLTEQNSQGRIITGSTTAYYLSAVALLSGMSAVADVDVVLDVTFNNLDEQYMFLAVRSDGTVTATGSYLNNGVALVLNPSATTAQINYYTGSENNLATGSIGSWVAGTAKRFRFRAQGSTFQFRTWDPAGAEPSTWAATVTSSAATSAAGKFVIQYGTGATKVAETAFVDTISLAAPPAAVASAAYATETFPGADGSAWPSQWSFPQIGTFTQQSGMGRMVSGSTSYRLDTQAFLSGMSSVADMDLVFDLSFPSVAEQYFFAIVRTDGTTPAGTGYPANGYGLNMDPQNSTGYLQYYNGDTHAITSASVGSWTVNTAKRFRLRVSGSTVAFRTWDPAAAEPSTWAASATDTNITAAGKVSFIAGTGGASTVTMNIDNISVTAPGS